VSSREPASRLVAVGPAAIEPTVIEPAASEPVAPKPVAAELVAPELSPEIAPLPETPPPPVAETAVDLPAPASQALRLPTFPLVPPSAATGVPQEPSGAGDAELLRRRWAEVLGTLERRRVTWVLVSQSAQVARVEGGEVHLAFASPQLAERFNGGQHAENVALAIRETLGLEVRVVGAAEDAPAASPRAASTPTPPRDAPAPLAANASTAEFTRKTEPPGATPSEPARIAATEDEAADGDAFAPDAHLTGPEVIAHMLGGTVIEDA
jgi:DNA polymerase-3 subunit gamma/tau